MSFIIMRLRSAMLGSICSPAQLASSLRFGACWTGPRLVAHHGSIHIDQGMQNQMLGHRFRDLGSRSTLIGGILLGTAFNGLATARRCVVLQPRKQGMHVMAQGNPMLRTREK
jgi:hypothetical protein